MRNAIPGNVKLPGDTTTGTLAASFSLVAFPGCFRYFLCHMGFYATTEVKKKNRYYPVFRGNKSENRLIKTESIPSVPDEFKVCVENEYDYLGRRFRKTVKDDYSGGTYTTTNVTTFIYNGWLPIAEIGNGYTNYMTWGLDDSGTLNGAGGVGGLLAKTTVTASDTNTYFYCYEIGRAHV